MIELAPAVVGDIDTFQAMIERDGRIFRGRYSLDDQRDFKLVLDQLHGAPFKPLLEIAAGGAGAAGADVALGDIALAPAVMRGVDGEAKCGVTVCQRTTDMVLDEGVVAADIELIEAQRAGRGLGDLF